MKTLYRERFITVVRDLKHQDRRGGRRRLSDEKDWLHVAVVNMTCLSLRNREPGWERREIRRSKQKILVSFRDVQIALLDIYMDGEIDDDEFLELKLIFHEFRSQLC